MGSNKSQVLLVRSSENLIFNSELNTLNSELKEGDLMLWIMNSPERGMDLNDELRMKSFELKSKIRNP
jgi:hypothetical protein